jgi:acyl-coenzyme A thioesterase PaaI-like protein
VSRISPDSLATFRSLLASDPVARHLRLRAEVIAGRMLEHPAADAVVVVLPGIERHVGDAARRSVHGGVLAAHLEAAAVLTLVALCDTPVATIAFTTAFVRPAAIVDTCALVDVVRVGRRIAHVRVEAWQGDRAAPVTTGHGTFSLR